MLYFKEDATKRKIRKGNGEYKMKDFLNTLKEMWKDTENDEVQARINILLFFGGLTTGIVIKILWGMF